MDISGAHFQRWRPDTFFRCTILVDFGQVLRAQDSGHSYSGSARIEEDTVLNKREIWVQDIVFEFQAERHSTRNSTQFSTQFSRLRCRCNRAAHRSTGQTQPQQQTQSNSRTRPSLYGHQQLPCLITRIACSSKTVFFSMI